MGIGCWVMGVGGHNFFLLANTYHPTSITRHPARPHRGRFACKEHLTTALQKNNWQKTLFFQVL